MVYTMGVHFAVSVMVLPSPSPSTRSLVIVILAPSAYATLSLPGIIQPAKLYPFFLKPFS